MDTLTTPYAEKARIAEVWAKTAKLSLELFAEEARDAGDMQTADFVESAITALNKAQQRLHVASREFKPAGECRNCGGREYFEGLCAHCANQGL